MKVRFLLDGAAALDTEVWRELAIAATALDDAEVLVPVIDEDERDDWAAVTRGVPLRLLVDERFANPDSGLLTRVVEFFDEAPTLLVAPEGGVAAEAAARLAVAWSARLIGGVSSWGSMDGGLRLERPGAAERNTETLAVELSTATVVTVKTWFGPSCVGTQKAKSPATMSVWPVPSTLTRDAEAGAVRQVERDDLDISDATVVVAGGLGFTDRDQLELLERLAEVLGGVVGATRPLVDKGWLPFERQIGTTGRMVTPDLYIGVGISGAFHHVGGIKASRIIAVNRVRTATLMNFADLGLVADLEEFLPALLKALAETATPEVVP